MSSVAEDRKALSFLISNFIAMIREEIISFGIFAMELDDGAKDTFRGETNIIYSKIRGLSTLYNETERTRNQKEGAPFGVPPLY
ncbi:hypothetical protein KM043_005056 [Ampulex compressa]|nr:hypothetical protein KM043_005056 [Ampulex compressa]